MIILTNSVDRQYEKMTMTPVGKLTVLMHNIFPSLTDRLEFDYMAKEPDSPFKKK